jgi:hypothetical protein
LLTEPERPPQHATSIEASLVWFDAQRLETHRPYLLKHGSATRNARVTRVVQRTNIETLAEDAVNALGMNDIGVVQLELTSPLFFDAYMDNRASGSFILIDPHSNATVAAGMIRRGLAEERAATQPQGALLQAADPSHASHLEAYLLAAGLPVVRTHVHNAAILGSLVALGLVVVLEGSVPEETLLTLAAEQIRPVDAAAFLEGQKGDKHVH